MDKKHASLKANLGNGDYYESCKTPIRNLREMNIEKFPGILKKINILILFEEKSGKETDITGL